MHIMWCRPIYFCFCVETAAERYETTLHTKPPSS